MVHIKKKKWNPTRWPVRRQETQLLSYPTARGRGGEVTSRLTWMGPQLQRLSHVNCVSGMVCVCVCVCVSHSVVSDSL